MNKTRIHELRSARGWTQERLAEQSGVTVRTIQRLEAGQDASLETLSMVSKALNVSVRDLFVAVDSEAFDTAVTGLDKRTAEQERIRNGVKKGWRYLYVGLGVVVTMVTIILVGASAVPGVAILIVPAYWVGGGLLIWFLYSTVIGPRLAAKYPLAAREDVDSP